MGLVDIHSLFRIYEQIKKITKLNNLEFSFKVDHGTYETAIEFVGVLSFHPPISENWDSDPKIFCPDLLDWHNKIIVEYEKSYPAVHYGFTAQSTSAHWKVASNLL